MTDNKEVWNVTFPAYRLEEFMGKINKCNNRLTKAGAAAQFSPIVEHFTTSKIVGGIELPDGTTMFGTQVEEPWVSVTMDSFTLTLGDYTFIAALVREEAGYTTHCAPGHSLAEWTRPPADDMHCDHCGTNRIRNRLYVVRDNNTGQLIQLGHNCIELFTGLSPKGVNALMFDDELAEFAAEDRGSRFDPASYGVDVRKVLAYAWIFTDHGRSYKSTAACEWGGTSTVSVVRTALFVTPRPPYKRTPEAMAEYLAYLEQLREADRCYREDADLLDDIISSVESVDASSDYGQNLRVILAGESGIVSGRNVGILASLVSVYARERELAVKREAEANNPPASGFLADVKVRIKQPITITIQTVKIWEGDYGYTTFMVGRTASQHVVVWRASGRHDWEPGDTLVLSAATVKEHAQFNEADQTVLTRCKIAEHVSASATV